jgi:3',5'-cyclic AMP phosphodiesterase CpdA
LRFVHVSDIHLFCPHARWRLGDWFGKRLTGWINSRFLRRRRLFQHADKVLACLMDEVQARRPDLLLFSGDASTLGTEEELARASALLRIGDLPGLAVPGNHDYYVRSCAASGAFERHFAPWLDGERLDGAVYPFARRVGPVYLIAVNSCTGNVWPWDATGRTGPAQRERLRRLLAMPHLAACPRVLVTHYPIARASGEPEDWKHRLHDLRETLEVALAGGVSLWLHGHRHHPYQHPRSALAPIPSICAGSATQLDCWTYAEYTTDGDEWHVERRSYRPESSRFERQETFSWRLGNGTG